MCLPVRRDGSQQEPRDQSILANPRVIDHRHHLIVASIGPAWRVRTRDGFPGQASVLRDHVRGDWPSASVTVVHAPPLMLPLYA